MFRQNISRIKPGNTAPAGVIPSKQSAGGSKTALTGRVKNMMKLRIFIYTKNKGFTLRQLPGDRKGNLIVHMAVTRINKKHCLRIFFRPSAYPFYPIGIAQTHAFTGPLGWVYGAVYPNKLELIQRVVTLF